MQEIARTSRRSQEDSEKTNHIVVELAFHYIAQLVGIDGVS